MLEQSEQATTFIGKLFETLILSRSKGSDRQIMEFTFGQTVNFQFYENMSYLVFTCKNQFKKLCSLNQKIEESFSRKIINTLMYLTKDVSFLLDEGILNLYMDLVQLKQKTSQLQQHDEEKRFIQDCIIFVEPLLYEFFLLREYKKMNKLQSPKMSKNLSLVRNFSGSSTEEGQIIFHPSKKYPKVDEQQIRQIREDIKTRKINQLLDQYLTEYQTQLNELQQVCKICSKNIKLNHLQEHVQYCQKKYILKQDLKTLHKKIATYANELIVKQKKLQNQGACHIGSGPLTQLDELDKCSDQQYNEILFQIINVHRIGSLKNTSKKINSQSKIKQNLDKYEELLERCEHYLNKNKDQEIFCHQINIFLEMERKVLDITFDLRTVELQYENLKEIVSSSTIRPPSRGSTNRMSQKKSRFACAKNMEKTSQNPSKSSRNPSRSSKGQSKSSRMLQQYFKDDMKEQQFCKIQQFDSQPNFDEQNLVTLTFKTKQSLGNNKNVHFHVQTFEEDDNLIYQRTVVTRKKSRKVKSMVMFDHSDSDEQQKQEQKQNKNSQSTSKPGENVSLKDFEILKFLGKGAFGKVFAVRKRNTQDLYALKMIDIDQNWGPNQFQQIANQHEIFKKVAGQHLVQAPFCFSEGGVHVFMMEFMPGGDLSKVLEEQVYLEEQRAKYVIAEIVLAIEHLHHVDIIHRDLKPENLVIDDRGHLKLTDFGLSQIKIQNKLQKVMNKDKQIEEAIKPRRRNRRTGIVALKQKAKLIGTPDYIAPQIINGISINNKSIDWWSLGVIAYEIMVGVRPFCGNTIQQVLANILKFNIEWPQIGEQDGMISQRAYDFIQKLLDRDFVNRLGASGVNDIKSHQFFDNVDWQNLKYKPAYIMPNYAKIKQLLQMKEDQNLRKQIQEKAGKNLGNMKMPILDNFIRFDYLGQKTVKEANKVKSKKTGTLRRLQSIKQFIADKENQPRNQWIDPFDNGQIKKKVKSFVNFTENEKIQVDMDEYI